MSLVAAGGRFLPPNDYPSVSCFDTSMNSWEILPSPSRSVRLLSPSITTVRGSVLGTAVISTGSDPGRWFSQEVEQGEEGEEVNGGEEGDQDAIPMPDWWVPT